MFDAAARNPPLIYQGERMRWRNADTMEHNVVPDTASLPEFATTGQLAPGAERSFLMNTIGPTTVHVRFTHRWWVR